MCSVFGQLDMENFQGDLTDVVRASAGHVLPSSCSTPAPNNWPPSDLPFDFTFSSDVQNSFGDPFLNTGDPLLHELNMVTASGHFTISTTDNNIISKRSSSSFSQASSNNSNSNNNLMKRQGNIFPRIRISQDYQEASPCNSPVLAVSSPRGINRSPVAPINANVNTNSPQTCLADNNTPHQLQISSPRGIGLKRRKNQARKVVCIPAPAAANSRSSGEVVPSDLWAWRKYGQKPIKGSPYPRGYYRCSSSKGCSARKQVERSRTDPNMLVITYTSEHNHSWPTQRNALAGSTRSAHPTKANTNTSNACASSRGSQPSNTKEEARDKTDSASPPGAVGSSAMTVKRETEDHISDEPKMLEMDRDGIDNDDDNDNNQLYMPDFHPSDDFFADLDELEGDSISLLLTQGPDSENKQCLDPFGNFFDCLETTIATTATTNPPSPDSKNLKKRSFI